PLRFWAWPVSALSRPGSFRSVSQILGLASFRSPFQEDPQSDARAGETAASEQDRGRAAVWMNVRTEGGGRHGSRSDDCEPREELAQAFRRPHTRRGYFFPQEVMRWAFQARSLSMCLGSFSSAF